MTFILVLLVILFAVAWNAERQRHAGADGIYLDESRKALADLEQAKAEAISDRQDAWAETEALRENIEKLKTSVSDLQRYRKELHAETKRLKMQNLHDAISIDMYDNLRSDELKNKLVLLKDKEMKLVKENKSLLVTNDSPKRILDYLKKQILRCFNSEMEMLLHSLTFKNVDSIRNKMHRSYDAINKIFEVNGVQITQDYFSVKLEQLTLMYAYLVKHEEEKEQRKAIREQMVEEEKVRREIEREKQKIEKEEIQFRNEIRKLMGYLQKSNNDVEKQLYIDKIQELEEKLKALAIDKENVLQREQNTRAGFVYIISNIGSFGENIYKIGMTRRLDPMERITELSSASVPFPFDVHAFIFSDDAPALEALLHNHFQSQKVNKVNPRKEFFEVDLESIKQVVLSEYNSTVQFVDIPDATEYHESMKLA